MKGKFAFLLIIIFTSSSLFAGPLTFIPDINDKSMNTDTVNAVISKNRWLESAQTHAGKEVFTFDHNNSALYFYYLEKYSSPAQLKWLESVMERADIFIDFIDEVLYRNDMPHELLYLPVTESAYRYNAVSRSGAVGIWQFMRNSISPYGMKIDDWADDRRDFWKSTEEAIAKLR